MAEPQSLHQLSPLIQLLVGDRLAQPELSYVLRSLGLGRALIDALQADGIRHGKGYIQLKCPVELPANVFYARAGFAQVTCEAGKARALNVWRLPLGPAS
jgi:hypothetical protein